MFGFIFGTACLIGLFKVARAGRCGGYGYAGYGGGHEFGGGGCGGGWGRRMHGGGWGHGHHGRGGFGRMGARGPMRFVFAKLQTTPGQEKVIAEEVEHVLQELQKAKGNLGTVRSAIANALRSPVFNQEALAEESAKHDAAMEQVREAIKASLAKIHEALDDKQRQELAAMIEGFGGFGRGPGNWV